jgi:hypothetical protein
MVDPATAVFWVSWQDDALLENADVVGADAAIAWGRERADRILIRLGHSDGTCFSAGSDETQDLPKWPPSSTPPEGWFTPDADDR